MRNVPAILAALVLGLGAAQAQQQPSGPLLGPGNVGEKDEKGRVKGAGAGEGPHREFNQQFERRVDRPEEAIEKEQKAKQEKARQEADRGQTPNSGSGGSGSGK